MSEDKSEYAALTAWNYDGERVDLTFEDIVFLKQLRAGMMTAERQEDRQMLEWLFKERATVLQSGSKYYVYWAYTKQLQENDYQDPRAAIRAAISGEDCPV